MVFFYAKNSCAGETAGEREDKNYEHRSDQSNIYSDIWGFIILVGCAGSAGDPDGGM